MSDFDAIVIGAGVQGSYTAYHLSKNSKTLLIDQFALPHSRGSSHGQTRIIRKAYSKACYTDMMTECFQLWKQLEAEANIELFRQTGLLLLGQEKDPEFQAMKTTLIDSKVPMTTLSSADFSKRFLAISLPQDVTAILEETAGILYADRALRTLQTLRIVVCYWKEKVPGTYGISKGFPCFLRMINSSFQHHFYGLPSNEYPGLMKVCYHNGNDADPDERDITFRLPSQDVNLLSDFLSKEFPGLDPKPAVIEYCMYTTLLKGTFLLLTSISICWTSIEIPLGSEQNMAHLIKYNVVLNYIDLVLPSILNCPCIYFHFALCASHICLKYNYLSHRFELTLSGHFIRYNCSLCN
ncbi:peroxisomal sarcosine oxidase isoform X3 [Hypanus sabinus]|uniref:peroxisomal sarcosine oxidase isoform X3 n=1 Tax=Hypanus sabinus TaxID=79690 RepID=UPI0028C416D6|nr:peroxisomal sarcosine oxidase isoform X3 [Hypanus sabinus]